MKALLHILPNILKQFTQSIIWVLLFINVFSLIEEYIKEESSVGYSHFKLKTLPLLLKLFPHFNATVLTLGFLLNYWKSWYYYSLILDQHILLKILLLLPQTLLEYMDGLCAWYSFYNVAVPMATYCSSMVLWLQGLKSGSMHNCTSGSKRILNIRIFKALALLNQYFNKFYSSFILPVMQLALIVFSVTGNNILIQYHSKLPMEANLVTANISLLCLITIIAVYPKAAKINTVSAKYLHSTLNVKGMPWVKKEIKACKKIKIHVGPWITIERYTSFKIIGAIIYWTGKSLLMFKRKA